MASIERQLQLCLNKEEKWADKNGFEFSKTKTFCMHFCNKRKLHSDPTLTIYNSQIPVVIQTKFLGVINIILNHTLIIFVKNAQKPLTCSKYFQNGLGSR